LIQGRSMAGGPTERFAQALALAPDHPNGLWYAGIAALQAGDDRAAIGHWERLLAQPVPDDVRTTLQHSLAQLRERSGIKAPAAGAPVQLRISVALAPGLATGVQPGDALFVYAQDPAGPPMPLAVQRLTAGQLPLELTLDDSNAMTPARKLSSVSRWRVSARISRSGSATPQPGDLEGSIELGREEAGKPMRIVIGRRRP
jgi:cytochrome c-type biogenesis protein CcmH